MEQENDEDRLVNSIDSIQSKEDLESFVHLLLEDLESNGDSWENPTLPRYLEALAELISSVDTIYRNLGREIPAQPSWRLIAELLHAAKYYE